MLIRYQRGLKQKIERIIFIKIVCLLIVLLGISATPGTSSSGSHQGSEEKEMDHLPTRTGLVPKQSVRMLLSTRSTSGHGKVFNSGTQEFLYKDV